MTKKSDLLPFHVYVRHVYYSQDTGLDEYACVTHSLNEILSLWESPATRYQQISFNYRGKDVDFTSYSQYTTDFALSSAMAFVALIDKLPKGFIK